MEALPIFALMLGLGGLALFLYLGTRRPGGIPNVPPRRKGRIKERLARRAEHLGEPAIATLLSINAALILAGMEEVALDVLNCAVSLEGQGTPNAEKGVNRNGD